MKEGRKYNATRDTPKTMPRYIYIYVYASFLGMPFFLPSLICFPFFLGRECG
jgi:hypothetical protein